MTDINLKKIFAEKKQETLSAVISFEGIDFEVLHTDAFAIANMLEKSKKTEWRRHQPVDAYDDDRFAELLARRVTGWSGCTLGKLADLVAIDVAGKDADTPVAFSQENLLAMMKNVPGLAHFLRQAMMDISHFRRRRQEAEVKN